MNSHWEQTKGSETEKENRGPRTGHAQSPSSLARTLEFYYEKFIYLFNLWRIFKIFYFWEISRENLVQKSLNPC